MLGLQRALSVLFPDQCCLCSELIAEQGGLCGACWSEVPFIRGLVCHLCGVPVPGDVQHEDVLCEDCFSIGRPWEIGRAALNYKGGARDLIRAFKYHDRPELASPLSAWLVDAGRPILLEDTFLIPVPLHWSRLLTRRYNQSAELAKAVSRRAGLPLLLDGLIRVRRTVEQHGLDRDGRFANVRDAFEPHPEKGVLMEGRSVCLIDDVLTSGATLASAAAACHLAGAKRVSVLVLARAFKDA